MPKLSKRALVTGGSRGIGAAVAKPLAADGADLAITVNNVQPGPIGTDLNPASRGWAAPQTANTALNRFGTVDEVAALVAFLAGPEASYITGRNLTLDGGTNA